MTKVVQRVIDSVYLAQKQAVTMPIVELTVTKNRAGSALDFITCRPLLLRRPSTDLPPDFVNILYSYKGQHVLAIAWKRGEPFEKGKLRVAFGFPGCTPALEARIRGLMEEFAPVPLKIYTQSQQICLEAPDMDMVREDGLYMEKLPARTYASGLYNGGDVGIAFINENPVVMSRYISLTGAWGNAF